MKSSKTVPVWLARLWELAGVAGMAMALATAIFYALAVGPWFATVSDSLEVSARALDAVDQTVEVIDQSLVVFEDTLSGVDGILAETASALQEVSAVVLSTAGLLSDEVPDQVNAIQEAMDGLIDTANVVDGILGALSFVGVDYNPEVPLDEALEAVNEELGALGAALSDNADELFSLAVSLNRLNDEIAATSASLDTLSVQLADSRVLIAEYQETATEARTLLVEAGARLDRQVWPARLLGTALLLLLGVSFSVVWWLGRSARTVVEPLD